MRYDERRERSAADGMQPLATDASRLAGFAVTYERGVAGGVGGGGREVAEEEAADEAVPMAAAAAGEMPVLAEKAAAAGKQVQDAAEGSAVPVVQATYLYVKLETAELAQLCWMLPAEEALLALCWICEQVQWWNVLVTGPQHLWFRACHTWSSAHQPLQMLQSFAAIQPLVICCRGG